MKTSGLAIFVLVYGCFSVVVGLFWINSFLTISMLVCVPMLIVGVVAIVDIRSNKGQKKGVSLAVLGILLNGVTVGFCIVQVREAAARSESQNNLRMLSDGMHNFDSALLRLPLVDSLSTTQEMGGEELEPIPPVGLSWRVKLLPTLEASPLPTRFRSNESWNSPHNLKHLKPIPRMYLYPDDSRDGSETPYRVFYGEGAAFAPKQTLKISQIEDADGTANTILIVEANETVLWTKPAPLPFTKTGPLPPLGREHGPFFAAIADGSIRSIPENVNPKVLRGAITWKGGEPSIPDKEW